MTSVCICSVSGMVRELKSVNGDCKHLMGMLAVCDVSL